MTLSLKLAIRKKTSNLHWLQRNAIDSRKPHPDAVDRIFYQFRPKMTWHRQDLITQWADIILAWYSQIMCKLISLSIFILALWSCHISSYSRKNERIHLTPFKSNIHDIYRTQITSDRIEIESGKAQLWWHWASESTTMRLDPPSSIHELRGRDLTLT